MSSICVLQQSNSLLGHNHKSMKTIGRNNQQQYGFQCKSPMKKIFKPLTIISESEEVESSPITIAQNNENVLLAHPALRGGSGSVFSLQTSGNSDIMSGPLTLLSQQSKQSNGSENSTPPQRIFMTINSTTKDHFAIIYPSSRNLKTGTVQPIATINLRGYVGIQKSNNGFILQSKSEQSAMTNSTLLFLCPDESALGKWLEAINLTKLTKENNSENSSGNFRGIPRKSSMPMMVEEEEEEDEE